MPNAILVPGRPDRDKHYDPARPSNSEAFWFSWLKRQLIVRDIHAIAIEPPFPFSPRYDVWVREFERFDITPDTILVGHSAGGGFLARYLSEHPELHVGRVALVAPWINPDDNPVSDTADFFHFDIDSDFPSRTQGTVVFVSSEDFPGVVKTVDILAGQVRGLDIRRYSDMDHFTFEGQDRPAFPELLEAIVT